MKNIIVILGMIFLFEAQANIEYIPNEQSKATEGEIDKSRSCFQELAVLGCGDPGDDQQHFRACLRNVHSSLSRDCKRMMSDLYGSK